MRHGPRGKKVVMLLKDQGNETIQLTVSLSQLKKLYVALFRQLHAGGAAALDAFDEDDMLLTLQTYLQKCAAAAGVDGTIHSEWEAYLGIVDAPSCEARFADRQPPTDSD